VRRIRVITAALSLLFIMGMPGWAVTETDHDVEIVIDDPENPCQPAVGSAWVNYIYHESSASNGSLHVTGTETGTFLITDGEGGPEATGKYTVWFGGNFNSKQAGFWVTLRARGEFEDGTPLQFNIVTQERLSGEPNFVQFNCHDGNGPVRVPISEDDSEELVFAVAYTDIDVSDGEYNPDVDRLIAKVADANDSGVLDAGDSVTTGEYPTDFSATTFGQFATTQHTVSAVTAQSAELCWVEAQSGAFTWQHEDFFLESYSEATPQLEAISNITDGFETAADDHIKIEVGSPSSPADTFTTFGFVFEDQAFIDIELNCQ
jgi:hypothetical protein